MVKKPGGALLLSLKLDHDSTKPLNTQLCLALRDLVLAGALRAGDRLTPQERRGLLEGFRRLTPPYTCPHGRPTLIEFSLRDLEKRFGRVQ